MDRGRIYDLEELQELWRKAPNGFWRDQYEYQIEKILNESPQIRENREELIQAVRSRDTRHVHYVQEKLNRLRQNETGGREIG